MDGGNTSLWTASYNPILAPRSYLYTAKFGHLGTGLPYAIGAKLAAPDRPVYLISGDGALGFNIQELETARRYNLPIVVVVSCDRGWGMERTSQIFAQLDGMVECDLYPDTRYDLVAQAFGCHGEIVDDLDQLRPALERASESSKPALIQVMVDPMNNLAPPGILVFSSMVYRAED
jgi:acetolactate synthase-1/2/3 large subunit